MPVLERWLIYGYVHEGTEKEFVMRKIAGDNWVVGYSYGREFTANKDFCSYAAHAKERGSVAGKDGGGGGR